ncbi:pyridoxamine 5'-phosphate oxidase family protein [Knoellia subterranea]|uniref:pyridoxamine 5'-phosphate oxidase family protein n=1 Tax=Knoellia subterranea TaxID=184882 RepID=UPI000B2E05DC|nr:pyridoxamine 5'-phosphate oxidase family protein [Knoellia subterranea]
MTDVQPGTAAHPANAHRITTDSEITALLGDPTDAVRNKVRHELLDIDRQWIAATPFVVVSTSAPDGSCDASPKGDPAGFVHVIDDRTIAIPERKGNRRADGYRNVLANPHVGLLFVMPGRGDTLRINGRAHLVSDAPWFDDMVVKGHRPVLALVVEIDEIFGHCAKAFMRSKLWHPDTWQPGAVPSRANIAHLTERPLDSVAALEVYYGASYSSGLY